jgi:hypothetical protein
MDPWIWAIYEAINDKTFKVDQP